ncbi:MAG TPA: hypothetical protein VKG65_09600 [Terriglobales bacterium]|nr:hypothetical protein [Terriglobales bacterium]
MKRNVLALAAAAEAGTGLLLLAWPPIVVRLLFGEEISGIGVVVSRFGGVCLVGLGVACWPGNDQLRAFYGMVTYSALALLYLTYIGVRGEMVGVLLWPAVVVHAILAVLLVRARLKEQKTPAA